MAGGYYFWRTFNALGKPKHAIWAVVTAVAVLSIIIGSSFIPLLDRLPNFVFYGLQFGLVYGVTRGYLLNEITEHIAAGKAVFGWGNTIVVAIVSMIITLGPLLAFVYFSPGSFGGTTSKNYGRLKHEVVFDSDNLSEVESDRIAAALTSAGFFDDEMQKSVDAAKLNERFVITMYCTEGARSDGEFMNLVRTLRSDVQKSFPTNPIVIDLVIDRPDNRIARLE